MVAGFATGLNRELPVRCMMAQAALLQWRCFGAASRAAQARNRLEQLGVASVAVEEGSASRKKVRNCHLQAATIGMRKRMAVSTRACGICSGELRDFGAIASASEDAQAGQPGPGWAAAGLAKPWGAESTVQLQCKHCFHDQCIRGWTIVGKKVRPPCRTRRLDSMSKCM